MKKSILVFALFVASMVQFSCSKEEVIPNVTAKEIQGNYQVTYFALNKTSYEMPFDADGIKLSGIVRFQPSAKPNFGTYRLMVFVNGNVQMDISAELEMRDVTPTWCNLYEKDLKVGKYYKAGTLETIELNGIDDKGNRVVFLSRK